ncbi:MAG: hypothetical protein JWQ38_3683 [Flavipsychrobacter sp.]|nr:hypothetical protein [Flavipsychrobacter sp.]
MYNKSQEQHKAEYLFLHTDFSQQEIADIVGIDRRTLYSWAKENNWQRARYIAKHAPPVLVEQYYGQLGALNQAITNRTERPYPTKEEAEIIRKLLISIKHAVVDKRPVIESIEALTEFVTELGNKDLELSKKVIGHMDEHIQGLVNGGSGLDSPFRSHLDEKQLDQEYEQWQREEENKQHHAKRNGGRTISFIPAEEDVPEYEIEIPADTEDVKEDIVADEVKEETAASEEKMLDPTATDGKVDGKVETSPTTPEPLPGNNITPNDNADLSTMEDMEPQENRFKGLSPNYYTHYLEEQYKISQDPNIKRTTTNTTGITIIKSPSPLWCLNRGIFFPNGQ